MKCISLQMMAGTLESAVGIELRVAEERLLVSFSLENSFEQLVPFSSLDYC